MAKVKQKKKKELMKQIDVHYLKTSNYRTYHVDGMFGGVTPSGKIYVELFTHRAVTPQIIRYSITAEGMLGEEIEREGKEGIVREIETGIVMDIDVAKVFRTWLDEKIKNFEEMTIKGEEEFEKNN